MLLLQETPAATFPRKLEYITSLKEGAAHEARRSMQHLLKSQEKRNTPKAGGAERASSFDPNYGQSYKIAHPSISLEIQKIETKNENFLLSRKQKFYRIK